MANQISKIISTANMSAEFRLEESLTGVISPEIYDSEVEVGEWLWLQNFYGPQPCFKLYGSPYDGQGNVPCIKLDSIKKGAVQKAAKTLWQEWVASFYERKVVVEKKVWCQGDQIWEGISDLIEKPEIQISVSWEKLCQFSQDFTNRIPKSANPDLVYLDNSGGFKSRAALKNEFIFSGISGEKDYNTLTFNLPHLDAVDAIEHQFGSWEGFSYEPNSIFYFCSCNGNILIALVGESKDAIKCIFSTGNCNYYQWFTDSN